MRMIDKKRANSTRTATGKRGARLIFWLVLAVTASGGMTVAAASSLDGEAAAQAAGDPGLKSLGRKGGAKQEDATRTPRRIVTGHRNGKAVFVSDSVPASAGYPASMGFDNVEFWSTAAIPPHPGPAVPLTTHGRLPAPGETQLLVVTLPPDASFASPAFDPAAARREQMRLMPGIAQCFEPDAPGMHRTPTVDYLIMMDGELVLELDDGVSKRVFTGDIIVQNGTRHALRNPGSRPATFAVVLIGDAGAPGVPNNKKRVSRSRAKPPC